MKPARLIQLNMEEADEGDEIAAAFVKEVNADGSLGLHDALKQ